MILELVYLQIFGPKRIFIDWLKGHLRDLVELASLDVGIPAAWDELPILFVYYPIFVALPLEPPLCYNKSTHIMVMLSEPIPSF